MGSAVPCGVVFSRRVLVVALVMGSLVAGCGDDASEGVSAGPSPGSSTSTPSTSSASTTTGSSTSTTAGGPAFGTTTVSTPKGKQGLLEKVEATADGKVDRITFTFEGDVPPYRVGYVGRPIVQDGSGDEVRLDGAAVLEVHFEPASGFDLGVDEGRQVYKGPNRLDLATRTVLDVVRVGDFEAVLVWAIGVDTKAPFRIRTDEARKVIVEVEIPA